MQRAALAIFAVTSALAISGCGSEAQQGGPPPAVPVTVAQPLIRNVTDQDEFVGRFEAVNSVDVRPRASGYLASVHFTDGQYVRQGQLLFQVDPRPAQAALAQARAQLVQAQATATNASTELERSRTLAKSNAASAEEVEQRTAAFRSAEAQVAAARAAVRARELELGFTRVTAPISGRASDRRVDRGNAVIADQTVLTTIVSTNPLHFTFDGSESLLLKYQRENAGIGSGTPVAVKLQDEAGFTHRGRLDFVDNAISSGTGTIRARAVIPNPDGLLRPGMFGTLQLQASRPYRAILVPDTAIATDSARRLVYIVDGQGNMTGRPVELGPLIGGLRVVRSGLKENERVVISGALRVRPGQKVQPQGGRIDPKLIDEVTAQAGAAPASSSAAVAGGSAPASR